MARGRKPGGAGPTLAQCLEEARSGRPSPVYLFDGDPFLAARAARELAEAIVPEAQRALNLAELDAAASPSEVAAELSTRGLFGGPEARKAVLLSEPAFLASKEDGAEAFSRAREMWGQGRQREAVRRLLALAAKAGWTAQDLDGRSERSPSAQEWRKELAVGEETFDADFVTAAARFALEREMKAARDDASALDALLGRGLPPGHVLVIAAGKVDGRLPLVKKLAAAGRRVTVALERQGAWDDERLVLGPVLEALLAGSGKRVDRAAEARLAELVGEDARTLASEVGKLVSYAGSREVIGAADVDAVVARVAADPFFALGNAVEARDLGEAMAVLDRALADGGSPHMIVASLAGTVRRLVVEKERARLAAGERPLGSFAAWQGAVLPAISEEELGQKKPYGFWMKYQASQRFGRGELLDALAGLAEADHAMKSGADGRMLLERVLWGMTARPETPARGAT